MSNCCGKGNVDSLLTKFNNTQKLFNNKQHPHAPTNKAAMTTQQNTGAPHPHSLANSTQLTPNGFLKFMRGKK